MLLKDEIKIINSMEYKKAVTWYYALELLISAMQVSLGQTLDSRGHTLDSLGHTLDSLGHTRDSLGHTLDSLGHTPECAVSTGDPLLNKLELFELIVQLSSDCPTFLCHECRL